MTLFPFTAKTAASKTGAPKIAAPRRLAAGAAALLLGATTLTACAETPGGGGSGGDDKVGVSLIVKTTTNPFFVSMQDGAKKAAEQNNVDLTMAAGKADGDEDGQIQAIENSISKGDKGILITPNGPAVVDAIKRARDAGLFVIALDTVPDDPASVDVTYATDNFAAGEQIGRWTAAKLDGQKAVIGLVDLHADKVVDVDVTRDQGFLTGMGIETNNKRVNGDEAKTGKYTGGKGGEYQIVGNQPSKGEEDGGRKAAELLLSQNPDINVLYAGNEPAASGAWEALQAAGKDQSVTVVTIDGGCAGVDNVAKGVFDATAQQYPVKMAEDGVAAIAKLARTGEKASAPAGKDFIDTGSALVTKEKMDGVESISAEEGAAKCWGEK